jgi:hypothetical protein
MKENEAFTVIIAVRRPLISKKVVDRILRVD